MALARKGNGNGNEAQPTAPPQNQRISRRRSLETPVFRPKLPTMGNAPSNLRPQVMDLSGPEVCMLCFNKVAQQFMTFVYIICRLLVILHLQEDTA